MFGLKLVGEVEYRSLEVVDIQRKPWMEAEMKTNVTGMPDSVGSGLWSRLSESFNMWPL
jgi:hypothetical protein